MLEFTYTDMAEQNDTSSGLFIPHLWVAQNFMSPMLCRGGLRLSLCQFVGCRAWPIGEYIFRYMCSRWDNWYDCEEK